MEYRIVSGLSAAEASKEVTDLLSQGWQLHGSVAISQLPDGSHHLFAQAMVKEDERRLGISRRREEGNG